MEDLKIKLNDALEELSQKISDIIDEYDSLDDILSWNEPDDILNKLDVDDVAEWLNGQSSYHVVDFDSRRAMENTFEDLQAELGFEYLELTDNAAAKPWKKDCVAKINELAAQIGWQELLNKLEQL